MKGSEGTHRSPEREKYDELYGWTGTGSHHIPLAEPELTLLNKAGFRDTPASECWD